MILQRNLYNALVSDPEQRDTAEILRIQNNEYKKHSIWYKKTQEKY